MHRTLDGSSQGDSWLTQGASHLPWLQQAEIVSSGSELARFALRRPTVDSALQTEKVKGINELS